MPCKEITVATAGAWRHCACGWRNWGRGPASDGQAFRCEAPYDHILRHAREAYNRQLKGRVESYVCVCNATQRKEARKKAKEKGCDHEFLDLLFNLPRGSKTIKEMLNKCAWRVTGF